MIEVGAITFDTYGTLVDWRSSVLDGWPRPWVPEA
jgi:FMN phosphatase YigB (HAD superfamily)